MAIKIVGIEDWLLPSTSWQSYDLKNNFTDHVDVDPNFYLKSSKTKLKAVILSRKENVLPIELSLFFIL